MKTYQTGDYIIEDLKIYKILGGEGKSGMGIVYVCYHEKYNTVHALKTFQDKFLDSKIQQDAFKREALAWVQLEKHPYIVQAGAVFKVDRRLFIELEYIPPDSNNRNTLTDFLFLKLTNKQIIEWAIQFCYGMEHAVSKGITSHRDIKPDNIMIRADGLLKITDFGLARLWDNKTFINKEFTKDSIYPSRLSFLQINKDKQIVGTPLWMAPEQFEGKSDIRSDIYSFGIVLYQMTNGGHPPFWDQSVTNLKEAHQKTAVPLINNILSDIISRCLRKNPAERYADFRHLRKDLEICFKKEIGLKPPGLPEIKKMDYKELFNRGLAFSQLGLFDKAIKAYKESLNSKPDYVEANYNLGITLTEVGNLEDAIASFERVLEIDPEDEKAWYNKAVTYAECNKLQSALYCYDKVININPSYEDAWLNKGVIFQKLGQYRKSLLYFDKVLNNNPNYDYAWFNKGLSLNTLGKKTESLNCYKKAIDLNPNNDIFWYNMGNVYINLKEYEKALMCFNRVLEINPNSADGWADKGSTLGFFGLIQDELFCLEKALELKPNYGKVIYNKGVVYTRLGKYKEALKLFKKAKKRGFSEAKAGIAWCKKNK